ncbi:MAG: DUF2147 domain-containing protein [Deltaproteobacteria bacterium]|jgi:uncharacterized protein (DUF2147 family)|nr:DUF2147 domain-containing protein [Syntrophaceae bacterium]
MMKKTVAVVLAVFVLFALSGLAQAAESSIAGVWSVPLLKGKDKGKEGSQIEIFEKDGVYYGKIVKLTSAPADALCTTCKKERKDKPLLGMLILWGFKKEAGRYVDGKVYAVEVGKEYKCVLTLLSPDKLQVTASVLFLSENHYWTRVK